MVRQEEKAIKQGLSEPVQQPAYRSKCSLLLPSIFTNLVVLSAKSVTCMKQSNGRAVEQGGIYKERPHHPAQISGPCHDIPLLHVHLSPSVSRSSERGQVGPGDGLGIPCRQTSRHQSPGVLSRNDSRKAMLSTRLASVVNLLHEFGHV